MNNMSENFEEKVRRYYELNSYKKRIENEMKEIRKEILDELPENSKEIIGNFVVINQRRTKKTLDHDKLKDFFGEELEDFKKESSYTTLQVKKNEVADQP